MTPDDLALLEQLVARARAAGATGPLYAHLRLQTTERETDVLFGAATHISGDITVLDWQTAPLSQVLFAHEPSDEYEVEVGDRVVTGRLLRKELLSFASGALTRVETADEAWTRDERGGWSLKALAPPELEPRPPAARRPFRSPLEVELDPSQRRVVELPPHRSVLILGEAGFGKTTVALHRLVALREEASGKLRAGVMVPTEGLRRLTEVMLRRRGVEGVDVLTYEAWASRAAHRVFRDLPKRESTDATSSVVKLKRHGALEAVLAEYARRRPTPAVDPDRPSRYKARAKRPDLLHLFGDTRWLEKIVERSGGELYPSVVPVVVEHTRVQFLDSAEEEHAHVDRDALVTVDGRAIDEGTPSSDVNTVDAEDYAVLFELERLRAQAQGAVATPLGMYDVLVVDEAQEFAPLELSLISRALRPGGIVIVAGDAAQQVDPTSHFLGWENVMTRLRARSHEHAVLEVNYRCPKEVTALARGVIGPERPDVPATPSITWARADSAVHLQAWAIGAVRRLGSVDPSASVAVIARSGEAARSLLRTLSHALPARLALEGDFEFRPGVTVTAVQEVKGLEFDYVLVPDADGRTYPDTAESRRALYVAVTRANHRLGLAGIGAWSPLLRHAAPGTISAASPAAPGHQPSCEPARADSK